MRKKINRKRLVFYKAMIRYMMLPFNLLFRPLKPLGLPIHVQLEPTNACNQRCRMCTRDLIIKKSSFLKEQGFKKVLGEIKPRKMNLSGLGEPFLHPRIFDFITEARKAGVGITLATNFTCLKGKVDRLIESGINEVKVSLDANNPGTYMEIRRGEGTRERVVDTLLELKERKRSMGARLPVVRLNYALQSANIDELVPVIEEAKNLGAESIYVQYLDYVDMGERKKSLVNGLTKERLKDTFRKGIESCKKNGITSNLEVWLRDLDLYWEKMAARAKMPENRRICYFPWFSTFIEANGDVKPCPIFAWKKEEGRMGNIYEKPFKEIWRGKEYREFRASIRRGEKVLTPCRQCIPQSLGNIYALFTKLHPGWNKKG